MSQVAGIIDPLTTSSTPEGTGVVLTSIGTGPNNITGTANTIRIVGSEQGGPLWAGAANPITIYGLGGADDIIGSSGDDFLYGDDPENAAATGDDTISGLVGNDFIRGGNGNDLLYGGDGKDTIFGDAGDDTISGGAGDDTLAGGEGNDLIDGGDGNDVIWGEQGNDSLYGGAGDDFIYGGQGNDIIAGGDGNDYIIGDLGNDNLTGGAGNDVFAFSSFGSANADVVIDFVSGVDKIAVQGAESQLTTIANFDPANVGTNTGLIYDTTNGKLYFVTGGAAQEVATFVNTPTLTANDFQIF